MYITGRDRKSYNMIYHKFTEFFLILSIYSCSVDKENAVEANYTDQSEYLENTLIKLHEESIEESKVDRSRVIISKPYGGDLHSYSVVEYGNDVWLYWKVFSESEAGYIYSEEVRYGNTFNTKQIRESLYAKIVLSDVDSISNISDNIHVLLESKKGEQIIRKQIILCRRHSWVKDIYESILQDTVDLFIPPC